MNKVFTATKFCPPFVGIRVLEEGPLMALMESLEFVSEINTNTYSQWIDLITIKRKPLFSFFNNLACKDYWLNYYYLKRFSP